MWLDSISTYQAPEDFTRLRRSCERITMTHQHALLTLVSQGTVYYRGYIIWVAPFQDGLTVFALRRGTLPPASELLYDDDPLTMLQALDAVSAD